MFASKLTFPLDLLTHPTRWLKTSLEGFWQGSSELARYLDFLLREVDPALSHTESVARVIDVIQETPQCRSFVLRPPKRWQQFKAGQYINVGLQVDGQWLHRNYSLSTSPQEFAASRLLRITVSAVTGGVVSNALLNTLQIGDTLPISPALGDFTLADENAEHALFIGAGSGITPLMSMLESRLQSHPDAALRLLYCVRNEAHLIFAERLRALRQRHPNFYCTIHFSDADGPLSAEHIEVALTTQTHTPAAQQPIYLCGPAGFMTHARAILEALGVPAQHIQQEHFATARVPYTEQSAQGAEARVFFGYSGKSIRSNGRQTLLELAELAGLRPKSGCRQGICHQCSCARGTGPLLNISTGQMIPADQQTVQACIALPLGDLHLPQA